MALSTLRAALTPYTLKLIRDGAAASACNFQRLLASLPDPSDDVPINEKDGKVFHPDLMNKHVRKAQYAVRGELYLRATQLQKQGKEIIYTNVGNPHALGQPPLTFNRQVLSLVTAPFLLDHPKVKEVFPADAIERARQFLKYMPGGVGAYSDSRGAAGVRQEVADFIARRDGYPSNPDHIFITDGASVAVRMALNALLRDVRDCVLVPIPQYPLYSASITLYGGTLSPYYLDEEQGWSMNIHRLRQAMDSTRAMGRAVRGLVFINPGNPTGQCLSESNLRELVKFAYDEKIVLMADEVYQDNIYQDERPFISAKKVMMDMGEPYASGVELLSFHTVSKGVYGECGLRGGYVEMTNIHPEAMEEIYKCASINLCPNTVGQIMVGLYCNEPKPGQPSYDKFKQEKDELLASLRRRAHLVTDGFNKLEGVTCNFTEGAMYSFPKITLPPKAIAAAKALKKQPDVFYCLRLLEETGISTVPGSGFGQEEGTFHLRTTILPAEAKMEQFMDMFTRFHKKFMDEYR